MGRDTLILVNKQGLFDVIFDLLREERSDVPDAIHRRDAESIIIDLEHPSL